jgi:predicted NUDIX family NTP pyrophosphohydrolase
MPAASAGILMYQRRGDEILVLLVHPGGPFWAKKDDGAWSIPKGEYEPCEEPKLVALREFEEELGIRLQAEPVHLGEIVQRGGKRVTAFAVEGELDVEHISSNSFEIEWPPRSGRVQTFPEIDRAAWFPLDKARAKILAGQGPLLDMLADLIAGLCAAPGEAIGNRRTRR